MYSHSAFNVRFQDTIDGPWPLAYPNATRAIQSFVCPPCSVCIAFCPTDLLLTRMFVRSTSYTSIGAERTTAFAPILCNPRSPAVKRVNASPLHAAAGSKNYPIIPSGSPGWICDVAVFSNRPLLGSQTWYWSVMPYLRTSCLSFDIHMSWCSSLFPFLLSFQCLSETTPLQTRILARRPHSCRLFMHCFSVVMPPFPQTSPHLCTSAP